MNKLLAIITLCIFVIDEFRISIAKDEVKEATARYEKAFDLAIHYREQYLKANGEILRANEALRTAVFCVDPSKEKRHDR